MFLRSFFQDWALLGLICGMSSLVLEGQNFQGTLNKQLVTDTSIGVIAVWNKADESLVHELKLVPDSVSEIYRGELNFGDAQNLRFGGALCLLKNGDRVLYVDVHSGGGSLRSPERILFSSPSQTYHLAEARFSFPLGNGPFHVVPAYVALPKSTAGFLLKPGQAALIVGNVPYVVGAVKLTTRQLLVRYSFDVNKNTANLAEASEWFDIDADGKFDSTPGSAERGTPSPAIPIFHVGSLHLQTASLDLAMHKVVLKAVPSDPQRIELVIGSHVPDFSFKDFSGQTHKLSEIKAKYILLDFWATWCVPCVSDLPYMKEAYEHFHDEGFEILGMNGDSDTPKPEQLLHKLHISWPEAKLDSTLILKRFQITSWPTLVLIDQSRTIVSTSQANHLPLSGPGLQNSLNLLLMPKP